MAAFLRELLIFELDRGDPGRFVGLDGVMDIEQATEPGVGIRDQRRVGPCCDRPGSIMQISEGRQPSVGEAEV